METYKLIILGEGGVGKSAITIQFTSGVFAADYDPTIEDAYRIDSEVDGEAVCLDILDAAGQDVFSDEREGYMRVGDGFLLVYSLTKQSTLLNISALSAKINRVKHTHGHVPIVLVGNKCDIVDNCEVSNGQEQLIARQLNCPYFQTSAKEKVNIEECFHELVREIRKSRQKPKEIETIENRPLKYCCGLL